MVDIIEEDDIQYLRTDDQIYLQCTNHTEGKYILSAEGFGQRKCHLESHSDERKRLPDMSICSFILKQALSIRQLHESLAQQRSAKYKPKVSESDGKKEEEVKEVKDAENIGRHRTILYGHAIRLMHTQSIKMLCSLATSSSTTDKLAFDVGLSDDEHHESCWWIIHPASKQRSEGEKVRMGDDLILVNVASERYLHMSIDMSGRKRVQASFQQTLWMVGPICTSEKIAGHLCGGDVIRFFHGHASDDCLTIPKIHFNGNQNATTQVLHPDRKRVQYEGDKVGSQARSLWRIELERVKWSGGHVSWGQPFHLRHVTTGLFLGMGPSRQILLISPDSDDIHRAVFCFLQNKDKTEAWNPKKEHDNMGPPEIKTGDMLCYIQHKESDFWLTYSTVDARQAKLGHTERPAELHVEGHMDDGFCPNKSLLDECTTAIVIRRTSEVFIKFIR